MNLYLKYRPKTINELDLIKVRDAFNRIIESSKLSHAYLLTGPRGAGKTSSARILARVVNCERNIDKLAEPCNECVACREILNGSALDVIEIDAASNRGIDDIRQLKEKIRLAPSSMRYKVYIIDEVHMLTTEAFNALLKTLEEPPERTLFILCTTELAKVPETIVSRCVQINYYKASGEELSRSLQRVVVGEQEKVDDEVIEYLSRQVDGSFRDGVKLIEQILSYPASERTLAMVEKMLVGAESLVVEEFVEALNLGETAKLLNIYREAVKNGVDTVHFLVSVMQHIRVALLAMYGIGESKIKIDKSRGILIIKAIDEVAKKLSFAPAPEILVEVMIIELCPGKESKSSDTSGSGVGVVVETKKSSQVEKENKESLVVTKRDDVAADLIMEGAQIRSIWRKMLLNMDKSQYSLEALLSKARPLRIEGKTLYIGVAYEFHKTQLESSRFRDVVHKMVANSYEMPLVLAYEINKDDSATLQGGSTSDMMGDDTAEMMAVAHEIFVN